MRKSNAFSNTYAGHKLRLPRSAAILFFFWHKFIIVFLRSFYLFIYFAGASLDDAIDMTRIQLLASDSQTAPSPPPRVGTGTLHRSLLECNQLQSQWACYIYRPKRA